MRQHGLSSAQRSTDFLGCPGLGQGRATGTRQMYSDVIFGSPSSNCNGLGVCKITALGQAAMQYSRCQAVGGLFSKNTAGDMQVLIPRSKVCTDLYRKYFMHGMIELKHPCAIPDYLRRHLSFRNTTISPGKYPIHSDGPYFIIEFRQICH
jgi:hypothetical protein